MSDKTASVSVSPHQAEFDAKYVTSSELCRDLGVRRCVIVFARNRGDLPPPIWVGGSVMAWPRAEVGPYVERWRVLLAARRAAKGKGRRA